MRLLDRLLGHAPADSSVITDSRIIDRFLGNPAFPWLISFPRTGSHWLRMLMELYFGKPSLRRVFYYPRAKDFTCYHWHDVDLATRGIASVIYLYRHPVDTVYSQLRYHDENVDDEQRVRHWSETYARHLSKWLFEEGFTERKTVIRYEGLQRDLHREFEKVCRHFDQRFEPARIDAAVSRVSKGELKEKTHRDDDQVVNLTTEYADLKEVFRRRHSDLVLTIQADINPRLGELWTSDSGAG